MSIETDIAYVQHDLWLARYCARQFKGDNSQRIGQLEARLAQLCREREAIYNVDADLRRMEKQEGVTRTCLVPMGMDEVPGRGANHGFLMEDGRRSRQLE